MTTRNHASISRFKSLIRASTSPTRCRSIRHYGVQAHAQDERTLAPFTRNELSRIRSLLRPSPSFPPSLAPPHTVAYSKPPSEAAVLIPLMNIDGQPHVLMEVRSKDMRVHAGEISFPGGKADHDDVTFVDTALREAREELALPSENVEILGLIHPTEYSLGNRARVWPFVGFVHSAPDYSTNTSDQSEPLFSLPISSLSRSPDEVSAILPLPLTALHPSRQTTHYFRLNPNRPYYKIQAGDFLLAPDNLDTRIDMSKEDLEVWGLSGWFLNKLAWTSGWMEQPKIAQWED